MMMVTVTMLWVLTSVIDDNDYGVDGKDVMVRMKMMIMMMM